MRKNMFLFDPNALVTVTEPELAQEISEIGAELLDSIGGGIDGSCGNNSACGAEINTHCTVVNTVCGGNNFQCQNPANNLGCPNVGCST